MDNKLILVLAIVALVIFMSKKKRALTYEDMGPGFVGPLQG